MKEHELTDPVAARSSAPREDRLRALVAKWREMAENNEGPAFVSQAIDDCADELESDLSLLLMRCSKCGTTCQDEPCIDGSSDSHAPECPTCGSSPAGWQGPNPKITKPLDASDEAIRQAALETASGLKLFAATWPEFYAFGLAVKEIVRSAPSPAPQEEAAPQANRPTTEAYIAALPWSPEHEPSTRFLVEENIRTFARWLSGEYKFAIPAVVGPSPAPKETT